VFYPALLEDSYIVTVHAPGYSAQIIPILFQRKSKFIEKTVQLSKGLTIKGTIIEQETREFISKANVYVIPKNGGSKANIWHEKTYISGRFQFPTLPPGPYKIVIISPAYQSKAISFFVGKTETLEFNSIALTKLPPLSIDVVDEDGQAIAGALIDLEQEYCKELQTLTTHSLRPQYWRSREQRPMYKNTDKDGQSIIKSLEPGRFRISARKAGYSTAYSSELTKRINSSLCAWF
jgi:hypothetical protein